MHLFVVFFPLSQSAEETRTKHVTTMSFLKEHGKDSHKYNNVEIFFNSEIFWLLVIIMEVITRVIPIMTIIENFGDDYFSSHSR